MKQTDQAFQHDGHVMVYARSGTATGRAFVLVHGLGMGRRVFREVARALGHAGVVYAVDLPGFGDSPKPRTNLPIPVLGELIAVFVASLPEHECVLVGHSMGAQVVVEALVRRPDAGHRAVLISPTVNSEERSIRWQTFRMLQDLAGDGIKVLVMGLIQYAKAGVFWYVRQLRAMLDHRVEAVLPELHAPTLVVRGEVDRVSPRRWTERVASLIPAATTAEVPGLGHEAAIRSPQPIARMIIEHAER